MSKQRATGEAGFTLVELVVTIAIMGIAFAVLVGGMGTAIIGSDIHRKQADVENILRSFAETVKAAEYEECANPFDYEAAFTAPSGYTATVTGVEFGPPPFNTYVNDCRTGIRQPGSFTAGTTFANPTNAYVIGEAPTPLTADASLQIATAGSASITLTGFGAPPPGSSLTLRVVHREGTGSDTPTVSVNGVALAGLTPSSELHEDKIDFVATSPISVTYEARLVTDATSGSNSLDGIWVQFTPTPRDPGLQRLTLRVATAGANRQVSQEVKIVMRRREA